MTTAQSAPGKHAGFATFACFVACFLATADQVFAVRALGVNVRLANIVFGAGLVAWLALRRSRAQPGLTPLAVAWLPFATLYALAAIVSPVPGLTLLKLGWFAFNLVTAYAWCRLFALRDLVRGFFAAFVLVSGMLVVDFMSGFTRGSMYMLGFGQPNDLIPGETLYRPHAFFYEPSYAASSVATSWALALTPMARVAPLLSTLLVGTGLAALIVTMSRVGWLYGILAAGARIALGKRPAASAARTPSSRIGTSLALTALVFILLAASERNRDHFEALVTTLGWRQTLERVCPLMQARIAAFDLNCLDSAERERIAGRRSDVLPETTSEGQRLVAAGQALSSIAANPWLGRGVTRGETRLIEPVTSNVWLEIAVEGGIPALLAFVWGLAYSMHRWHAFKGGNRMIGAMLVLYFAVAWQFLQTFPRLDQWVMLWVALVFTASQDEARQRHSPPARSGSDQPRPPP
jgi:hypothetical protein